MKYFKEEIYDDKDNIQILRRFYFKINSSKMEKEEILIRQIKKVIMRLSSQYPIIHGIFDLDIGLNQDDFLLNKLTLTLEFTNNQ